MNKTNNRYRYINEKKEHIHTLDNRPLIGTSTVVKIVGGDKTGGLIWWASGMAISNLGWTTPKIKDANGKVIGQVSQEDRLKISEQIRFKIGNDTPEEYLARLDEAYKAHDTSKKKSGVTGTDRHELLEKYVKACIKLGGSPIEINADKEIQSFVDWAVNNIKQFLWSELHCYNEELWTGGIADVGWEDGQGRIIAGDFKSSKEAYVDQFVQIAGYDLAISHSGGLTPDGDIIFRLKKPITGYCVIPFGGATLKPEMVWDIESYKKGFLSALSLHILSTNYKK